MAAVQLVIASTDIRNDKRTKVSVEFFFKGKLETEINCDWTN